MRSFTHRIKYAQFHSVWIRRVLRFFFREGAMYPILFGPLRGFRLRYDRALPFQTMLGLGEREKFEVIQSALAETGLLKPGMVACDIGANVGIYSLWLSKLVRPFGGSVVAIEASPEVFDKLSENLRENGADNVTAISAACSDKDGEVDFYLANNHHTSSLIQSWAQGSDPSVKKVTVKTVTLDSLFSGREAPDFIKMDIEGGGVFALKAFTRCIEEKRPLLYLESHTPSEDRAISDLALRFGYRALRLADRVWVTEPKEVFPHPEGMWGNLLLVPDQKVK